MFAVITAVLAVLALCVIGVVISLAEPYTATDDDPGGEHDAQADEAWIAELHALNQAMPYVRKHRARLAARPARHH
ncbi:hypothetical protein JNUCC0626_19805 [Lentzea sp. JNUCC 0626]|uniref:hypothetical protein n=1 Tax=Lentzea sp. JNUCC 0626 TaxID=3367513 RepID=UPI00374A15DE